MPAPSSLPSPRRQAAPSQTPALHPRATYLPTPVGHPLPFLPLGGQDAFSLSLHTLPTRDCPPRDLLSPLAAGCSSPLGLTTGDVLDWQISASSSYPATWDAGCQVKYARLHQPNGRAWCAGRRAAGEWVLVDLGVPAKVRISKLTLERKAIPCRVCTGVLQSDVPQ